MSDLVERLRAWARDLQTGRDCFGADQDMKEAADEIERLRAQVAALQEALLAVTYAAHELCAALDIDLDETVIRGKNFLTDEVAAQKSLADIFAQVAAALEEKG